MSTLILEYKNEKGFPSGEERYLTTVPKKEPSSFFPQIMWTRLLKRDFIFISKAWVTKMTISIFTQIEICDSLTTLVAIQNL